MTLLAAMNAALESCRRWTQHSGRYFLHCIARKDICCNVDENMWLDRQEHLDAWTDDLYLYSTGLQWCRLLPKFPVVFFFFTKVSEADKQFVLGCDCEHAILLLLHFILTKVQ